jgi:hypothetical protein
MQVRFKFGSGAVSTPREIIRVQSASAPASYFKACQNAIDLRTNIALHTDSFTTPITNITMASKALLGFNAAAAIGAFVLYLGGARVVLDSSSSSSSGEAQPPVDVVQSSPAEPALSSDGKGSNYTCTYSEMKPKFLSYDPIMVYIENFLSPYETEHLKKLA